MMKLFNCAAIASLISLLSACSNGYSSSFACGDARGGTCLSMDVIDRMIQNGEIEKIEQENNNNKLCRGRKNCFSKSNYLERPVLNNTAIERPVTVTQEFNK